MLREIYEPAPGLRVLLIARLEYQINKLHAQNTSVQSQDSCHLGTDSFFDFSWQLFDQNSLHQIPELSWPT